MDESDRLFALLDQLIDRWCDRRALRPLRTLLTAYPPRPRHSDDWVILFGAIRNLKGLSPTDFTVEERDAVAEAHAVTYQIIRASFPGAAVLDQAG